MVQWFRSPVVVALLAGCSADEADRGPTFGGDARWSAAAEALDGGRVPGRGDVDVAGFLAAHPLALDQEPCDEPLCVAAKAAWRDDGTLWVALSVEGAPEDRPPADVAFALDRSSSTEAAADVTAATVGIALDHLRSDDTVAITAFRSESHLIVAPGPVTELQRAWAWEALGALDEAPEVEDVLPRVEVLTEQVACESAPEELISILEACGSLDVDESGEHPCGEAWPVEDDELDRLSETLDLWSGWWASPNPELGAGVEGVLCDSGTDVAAGLEGAGDLLPNGSEARGARVFVASDFDDGLEAVQIAGSLASYGVGTTVLALTESYERDIAGQIAQAPGGLLLDATHPEDALFALDSRFDALLIPRAWGLEVGLADDDRSWSVVRHLGTTDAAALGANAVFASQRHGVLGVVLDPSGTRDRDPMLVVKVRHLDGTDEHPVWVAQPAGLIHAGEFRGDDYDAVLFGNLARTAEELTALSLTGATGDLDALLPVVKGRAKAREDEQLLGDVAAIEAALGWSLPTAPDEALSARP